MRRLAVPLLIALVVSFTATASAEPDPDDAGYERVIAVVNGPASSQTVGRMFDLLGGPGVELVATLDNLGLVILDVDPASKAALASSLAIGSIVPARTFELFLDESGPVVEADDLHDAGLTGSGSTVAVLDSGIDTSAPALAGAVVAEACFLTGTPDPISEGCPGTSDLEVIGPGSGAACTSMPEECSHGTHVAGIIASNDLVNTGIAPDVSLISIRVTAIVPGGTWIAEEAVLAALDHVVGLAGAHNIVAVNLSLGGPAGTCQPGHWQAAIDAVSAAGIAIVAASGNNGTSASVAFPACLDGVVAVGASDPGTVADFTQWRSGLDLVAPGEGIESTVLAAYDPDGFAAFSGTSMAAPHVSAALALLDGTQSGWAPDRVVELLRSTGEMVARPTADPDDRDPRFPELRLGKAADFEPFGDADYGYWVAAADWAKVAGVSNGVGGNMFSPESTLDRAQAVTLLWRLMGSPMPTQPSAFVDVPAGSYFSDSVAWAVENGVTTGLTAELFDPNGSADRSQIATFIWRMVGEPEPAEGAPFVDVPAGIFFEDAAAWMAEQGITTGTTSTTFSPGLTATRAQMITFLWRLVSTDTAWSDAPVIPDAVLF